MSSASKSSDLRFAFGENWADFLVTVNKEKIENACKKLTELLGLENLSGKSFLDIGSGSGLSSLAAHYLGATVHSFDFDEVSVNCTEELRRQYGQKSRDWVVGRGDVLDEGFMRSLGEFDIVYSWGVLHHTGNMSLALKQSRERVRPGGLLFVAIYNDQGSASRRWRWIKRTYNRLPVALRFLVALPSAVWLWGPTVIRDASQGNPFASWRQSERERGMSPWHDLKDWIGGYPFEVASPDAIIMPMQREGFVLRNLVCRTTGHGCNEYVFQRVS